MSTASEVFLIFTTQLCTCLCNYNAIVFISCQEGSIATGILPAPNTPLSSLPVGSKIINMNSKSLPSAPCMGKVGIPGCDLLHLFEKYHPSLGRLSTDIFILRTCDLLHYLLTPLRLYHGDCSIHYVFDL